jgi:spermidine synthase
VVIFLTGFTFLIYEVCWNRLLSLVLGTTVTASTIVLASFMAGFGTGAWFWGKHAAKDGSPGKLLALLLGGVGIVGGIDYFLIADGLPNLYAALGAGSSGLNEVFAFAIAAALLSAQTFLMGGIFPTVCKIVIRSDRAIASSLGYLYALETLGSTFGGLAAGFIFLALLGQMNTVLLAVLTSIALAIWLYTTRKALATDEVFEPIAAVAGPEDTGRKKRQDKPAAVPRHRQMALVGAFVCGFVMLGLQVLWIRAFRVYLTNTSYTFALVASLVILGLFVGSALYKRRGGSISDYPRSLLLVILYMGALTGLGLLLVIFMPQLLMFPFQSLLGAPLARILLLPLVASLLIVFPPAIFSGYAFPLTCKMYTTGSQSISRDVGVVLLVNTIGCVIGPIVTTFVFLPLLGVAVSILLTIGFLIGAAIYIVSHSKSQKSASLLKGALYLLVAVLLVVVIAHPAIRILPPSVSRANSQVLFYRESVEGTLSVAQDRSGAKSTFVNNAAVIGSTYDAVKVVKMVGHFPFLVGGDLRKVLVIGFGIGVTTSAIASHSEVESIECVELVPGLKDAAVYYRDMNHNVVADPRLRMISGDGRHYLQKTSNKYDLISCDPTHPILGSGNLYTRDYFELCRAHLNPGGLISQYLPLHKLRTAEFLGIIKTFQSVFPNCTVWLGHYHAVLLGSLDPIQVDFQKWSDRVAKLGADPNFYIEPYHLAATLVLDGPTIARLGAQSRINSDDHSYTEFFAPACLDDANLVTNLRFLQDNRAPIGTVFSNVADTAKLARFVQGNQLLTESILFQMTGDNQRGLQSLREATRVNPEDQEYPFLIKLGN